MWDYTGIFANRGNDSEEEEKDEAKAMVKGAERGRNEVGDTVDKFQCMTLHRRESTKKDSCGEKYGLWRQEQKTRAVRLEKQLKMRWELDDLIEEQLNRFNTHYNRAVVPTQLDDVAELLMPRWTPPHELASLYWLGDWRPSAILDLLRSMACFASFSSLSTSTSLLDSSGAIEQMLLQLIHEIRIEESIIDEEMAEIQATCVLHLPFARLNRNRSSQLGSVRTEFTKIERVITKAHQLRFKAMELVVKKVLSQTDAAEFLVAFSGIQDILHHVSEQQKSTKVVVTANPPVTKKASHYKSEAINIRKDLLDLHGKKALSSKSQTTASL